MKLSGKVYKHAQYAQAFKENMGLGYGEGMNGIFKGEQIGFLKVENI